MSAFDLQSWKNSHTDIFDLLSPALDNVTRGAGLTVKPHWLANEHIPDNLPF